MKNISIVNMLAAKIRQKIGGNRSESMRKAWALVKAGKEVKVLVFKKLKTESIETRIVAKNWFDYQAPTGGKKTINDQQILFADLVKVAMHVPCIISTYASQIISAA